MAAGDSLGRQFFKQNPNQMALPGLEEHSHPLASALAQGYTAKHHVENGSQLGHVLSLSHEAEGGIEASSLEWAHDNSRYKHSYGVGGYKKGEIIMVETNRRHEGKGLASGLYGFARQNARIKPQHSPERTSAGNSWANAVSDKYGGSVPRHRGDYYD